MFFGIDLGSRFVKLVYGIDGENFNKYKFETINFYKKFCGREKSLKDKNLMLNLDELKETLDLDANVKIKKIVSTGYGRNIIGFKNSEAISEIVAHYLGVVNFLKYTSVKERNFLILDIGGQDTKVISVKNLMLDDFFMNDKCAAGSGRYFENMANILNMPLEKMSVCFKNFVNLPDTCAIFGESEIVSHIVNGEKLENIASGVNYSIFSRLKNYLEKFDQKLIIFVGGMNQNFALKYFIENNLTKRKKVFCIDTNEYNGAYGCFCEAAKFK